MACGQKQNNNQPNIYVQLTDCFIPMYLDVYSQKSAK